MQRPAIVANAYLFCVSSNGVVEDRYSAEVEFEKASNKIWGGSNTGFSDQAGR
jgi:hypothetical protein